MFSNISSLLLIMTFIVIFALLCFKIIWDSRRKKMADGVAIRHDYSKFPAFRYILDPIAAGSFVKSDSWCSCCWKNTGYIYSFTILTSHDEDYICPWCFQDGSAKYLLKRSMWTNSIENVPEEIGEIIKWHTPQIDVDSIPYWPTHCNDAMQFIESRQLMEYVKSEHDFCLSAFNNSVISESWEDAKNCSHYFVFIYQCLHCQMKKGYLDQRVIMTN